MKDKTLITVNKQVTIGEVISLKANWAKVKFDGRKFVHSKKKDSFCMKLWKVSLRFKWSLNLFFFI